MDEYRPILAESRHNFHILPHFNSETTEPIFTTFFTQSRAIRGHINVCLCMQDDRTVRLRLRRYTTWKRNAISIRIFSAETTGPIFTKILHDVAALVALFNHAYTWRYPIPFLNARAISATVVGKFARKLVAIATSLKISEKEGRIDHMQFNTTIWCKMLWKSVQRILRYFSSERKSPVPHKIGCHGNVPWGIGKMDQIK